MYQLYHQCIADVSGAIVPTSVSTSVSAMYHCCIGGISLICISMYRTRISCVATDTCDTLSTLDITANTDDTTE